MFTIRMHDNIDSFISTAERLSKKIQPSLSVITESLLKTKFSYTGRALLSFVPKSGLIASSVWYSCQTDNPYSASILFRSLIEHSFRHLYIFVKALNENNDSVGKEYYHSLKSNEDLESVEKIMNYKKVVYPADTQWSTKGNHNKEIRETAKQFRIEQIFFYLIGHNNDKDSDIVKRYKKEYLLERLVQYTNMSSSVHGGPFGESALYELRKDKNKLKSTLNKFASDTLLLHKSIVETTYLFAVLMDNNNQKYYDDIVNINPKKLIIDVKATDLNRAVKFYVEVLGLECRVQKDTWAAILIGDAEIHLYLNGGAVKDVEFYVEDLDSEVKKLNESGVKFISGMDKPNAISVDKANITRFPWGRAAFFRDSEGNELALVKDIE